MQALRHILFARAGSRAAVSRPGLCALVLVLGVAMANSGSRADCGRLQGTFIQPTVAQAAWPMADWRRLFNQLETLVIKNLFVQWTVLHDTAFFPTTTFHAQNEQLLPMVLDLAGRSDMQVWIGLRLDARYWQEIAQGPDRVQKYFAERLQDTARFLGDLAQAAESPAFAGWYITDEVDDQTWDDGEKRAILKRYLSDTVALLKARRPRSRVAISGFSNSTSDPGTVAEFWPDVIKAASIDLLLFQDGVGEGKLALADLARYQASVASAVQRVGAQFGAVVELFRLTANGERVPASFGRIRDQLAVANRFSDFPPVAFSVPDYMSDLPGKEATDLFSRFALARKNCHG